MFSSQGFCQGSSLLQGCSFVFYYCPNNPQHVLVVLLHCFLYQIFERKYIQGNLLRSNLLKPQRPQQNPRVLWLGKWGLPFPPYCHLFLPLSTFLSPITRSLNISLSLNPSSAFIFSYTFLKVCVYFLPSSGYPYLSLLLYPPWFLSCPSSLPSLPYPPSPSASAGVQT